MRSILTGAFPITGLHGEVEEEPGHEEWPLAASWGSELDHRGPGRVHVVNEGALACELLLALQVTLESWKLKGHCLMHQAQ